MHPELAKKMMSRSGRWAIMARRDESSPWKQVESVADATSADNFVDELEDDKTRNDYIAAFEDDDDWSDDAPMETP